MRPAVHAVLQVLRLRASRGARGIAALALGLAFLRCGGGGGGGTSAPPPPLPQPTAMQVTVTADPVDFNKVVLGWNLPPAANRVQIESQMDGSEYQGLTSLPMGTSELLVTFDPAMPERHTFGFRVTALNGGTVIAQAEGSHRRSFRPVLNAYATPKPASGAVGIFWGKDPASVATGFRLERLAEGGTWTSVGPGALTYQGTEWSAWDLSPVAEGDATYRVVPTDGTERGMPVRLTARVPLLAPDQLALAPAAAGRTLSWANRSRLATIQSVYRSVWGVSDLTWGTPILLGQVGAAATSYQDPASPAEGRVAYQVVASLPGIGQTESTWCLAGGPSSYPELGLTRSRLVLPFSPLLRDADGAWMGTLAREDPALPFRLGRVPAGEEPPLVIPPLMGGLYSSWSFAIAPAPAGGLDLQVVESAAGSFAPLALRGYRRAAGAWTSRTYLRGPGLYMMAGGFLADGTVLAPTVDNTWQRGLLRLAMDGTAVLEPDPYGAIRPQLASRLFGLPTGEALSLVMGDPGWLLGLRAPSGAWSFQPIPEVDPTLIGPYALVDLTVDGSGALHALFAAPAAGGLRYDYLRVRPGGPAEFLSLGSGPGSPGAVAGQIAATPDGQRIGFALMDRSGALRTGVRAGAGAWTLRSATVPDAGAQGASLAVWCGFKADGRFWVLHKQVAHPFAVRYEDYHELLEEP